MRTLSLILLLALCGASWGVRPRENNLWRAEINFYGGDDRSAIIFYDWDGHVAGWRFYQERMRPIHVRPGLWTVTWQDGGSMIRVTVQEVGWSRTWEDKELAERKFLPDDQRKGLRPF